MPWYKTVKKSLDKGEKLNGFTLQYVPCNTCSFSEEVTPSKILEEKVRAVIKDVSPQIWSDIDPSKEYTIVTKDELIVTDDLYGIIMPDGTPVRIKKNMFRAS